MRSWGKRRKRRKDVAGQKTDIYSPRRSDVRPMTMTTALFFLAIAAEQGAGAAVLAPFFFRLLGCEPFRLAWAFEARAKKKLWGDFGGAATVRCGQLECATWMTMRKENGKRSINRMRFLFLGVSYQTGEWRVYVFCWARQRQRHGQL